MKKIYLEERSMTRSVSGALRSYLRGWDICVPLLYFLYILIVTNFFIVLLSDGISFIRCVSCFSYLHLFVRKKIRKVSTKQFTYVYDDTYTLDDRYETREFFSNTAKIEKRTPSSAFSRTLFKFQEKHKKLIDLKFVTNTFRYFIRF